MGARAPQIPAGGSVDLVVVDDTQLPSAAPLGQLTVYWRGQGGPIQVPISR